MHAEYGWMESVQVGKQVVYSWPPLSLFRYIKDIMLGYFVSDSFVCLEYPRFI